MSNSGNGQPAKKGPSGKILARREAQRQVAVAPAGRARRHPLGGRIELGEVPRPEGGPLRRVMPVPGAQRVRRREVLRPVGERGGLLRHAAGPQAIDEHAQPGS